MMKERPFLDKHRKNIDYWFIGILIGTILLIAITFGVTNTYNATNKNITSLSNNENKFTYDNFWHKFNTYSVIMINIKDTKRLVSQNEIENFQIKFFKDFGLINNDGTIERGGIPVDPEILFCYIEKYKSEKIDNPTIIKKCEK